MKNTTVLSEYSHFLLLGGSSVLLGLAASARIWGGGTYWDGFFTGMAVVMLVAGTVALARKFREMWNKTKRYGNH